MSSAPLAGLRVVEASAFVAASLAGMTLGQLGADVIRIDDVRGGRDFRRWPLAPDGHSLFWAGMNKHKRSVQLDLRSSEGRELMSALICAPGATAGVFLTNFPTRGGLSYDQLTTRRPDLIMAVLSGNHDLSSEVDYTVNPATGFPSTTGPRESAGPLNGVFPAWDALMGQMAALGVVIAECHRRSTGRGQLIRLALWDVALAMVGNLGRIAAAQLGGSDATPDGNYVYGAFGCDFALHDGRRVMVVAITNRQWDALVKATGTKEQFAAVASATGHDFTTEGGRYEARELIAALVRPWFAQHSLPEVRTVFDGCGVSWGPYRTFAQLVCEDPRCSLANPMFETADDALFGKYLMPRSPLDFSAHDRPQSPAGTPRRCSLSSSALTPRSWGSFETDGLSRRRRRRPVPDQSISDLQELTIWRSGELPAGGHPQVSVWDHGLLYGDGVFEGLRLRDGWLYRPDDHLMRLRRSAQMLVMEVGFSDDELLAGVTAVAAANGLQDAHVRIVVTRGVGLPGLDPRLGDRHRPACSF